jgi:hypothetical protein
VTHYNQIKCILYFNNNNWPKKQFHGTSNSVDNNSVLQNYPLKTDKSYIYQQFLLSQCYTFKPFRDILIIKPTRCTDFSNLFWNETLHLSHSSSVRHQELFTVHTAMVYVIMICRQLSSRIRMELQFHPDPARKLSAKLYDIYHCCVYSERLLMMDRGTVLKM